MAEPARYQLDCVLEDFQDTYYDAYHNVWIRLTAWDDRLLPPIPPELTYGGGVSNRVRLTLELLPEDDEG